jgi:GTP-binding protein
MDEAKIEISAGHGGKGCVSFRREKYAPMGGPDGGDGGRGANVYIRSTHDLSTLQDFRYLRVYKGLDGKPGSGANKAGRDAEDLLIRVPVGTVIKDFESGETLFDFTADDLTWTAGQGGRGGKGNSHFATAKFQAPKFAQPGEAGEFKTLKLALKLIADVGIIGFPNAGKSTLISKISAARPKIADYAFTTLSPNLGVVSFGPSQSFVVADIPGLIEGAHAGAGLGHKFLKHIERTKIFLHMLDGAQLLEQLTEPGVELESAIEIFLKCYQAIRRELELYDEKLLQKAEIIVINKSDLLPRETLEKAQKILRKQVQSIRGTQPLRDEPFIISGVTGDGLQTLLNALRLELYDPNSGPLRLGKTRKITLPDGQTKEILNNLTAEGALV